MLIYGVLGTPYGSSFNQTIPDGLRTIGSFPQDTGNGRSFNEEIVDRYDNPGIAFLGLTQPEYVLPITAPGGGGAVDVAATIAGVAAVTVDLTVARALAVSIAGTSTVTPALSKTVDLTVSVAGVGQIVVQAHMQRGLEVQIQGQAVVVPALSTLLALQAAVQGTGAVTVALTVDEGGTVVGFIDTTNHQVYIALEIL